MDFVPLFDGHRLGCTIMAGNSTVIDRIFCGVFWNYMYFIWFRY